MSSFLKDFVYRAGIGLEQEDRSIIGSSRIHDQIGGILRIQQERFWQYIIFKSVYSKWKIEVEKFYGNFRYDFAKKSDDSEDYDCFFEMKNWLSELGESELEGICKDIKRLNMEYLDNSVIILLSSNRRGDMNHKIEWLENKVKDSCGFQLDSNLRESFCFDTISHQDNEAHEFWISAWPIKVGSLFKT